MSSEWPILKIEDVAERVGMGPFGSSIKVETFVESGVPVISGEHLHDIALTEKKFRFITEQHAKELAKSNVFRGDVVFTHAGTIGQVSVIPENSKFEKYIISQRQFFMRCNRELVNPLYVVYFFKSPQGRHKLLANASQVGVPSIARPVTYLRSIEIPIPSLAVQNRIVEVIESIRDRITLLHETNATLESIAQALFKSWFVDFDPVRAKAEGRLPEGIDAATAELFPDGFEETELGLVPRGWRYSTVQNSFVLTMGQSPPGSTYSTDNSDMPFYQGCTDFGFRFPTQRMYCSAPTRLAETGDTLVSVRAPVGDVNMAIEKCCIGRGLASVRHPNFQSFTFYAISNLGKHFKNFDTEGTIFGSINKADFQSLPVIDAPLNVVTEFENIATQLDSKVVQNEHSLRVLSELRDTLLPRLISGQLRIADAEAELEKATA